MTLGADRMGGGAQGGGCRLNMGRALPLPRADLRPFSLKLWQVVLLLTWTHILKIKTVIKCKDVHQKSNFLSNDNYHF